MNKRELQIYRILEKNGSMWYNKLKDEVVNKKKIVSERPFRETLKGMVENDLVLKIPTEGQKVLYSVDFEGYKYEKEGIEYLQKSFDNYEKEWDIFSVKRKKLSKLDQSALLITFLKSLYLERLRFEQFEVYTKTKKVQDLKVQLTNLIDIAEANLYYSNEEEPKLDIGMIADRLLSSWSSEYLDEFKQNLKSK